MLWMYNRKSFRSSCRYILHVIRESDTTDDPTSPILPGLWAEWNNNSQQNINAVLLRCNHVHEVHNSLIHGMLET